MTVSNTPSKRPVPVPDDASKPFWDAAAEHVLTVARCSRCRSYTIPVDIVCPHCHSTEPAFGFEAVGGRGIVRSWTTVRQSFLPGFAEDIPFVLVDVELDEQPDLRLIGRLLDGPGVALHIGDRVRVAFEDLGPGISVPAFVLDGMGDDGMGDDGMGDGGRRDRGTGDASMGSPRP